MDDSLIAQKKALEERILKFNKLEMVEEKLATFDKVELKNVKFSFNVYNDLSISTFFNFWEDCQMLNNQLAKIMIDYLYDLRERLLKDLEE